MGDIDWSNNLKDFQQPDPLYVTRPTMPQLEQYTSRLTEVWESGWLTNEGALHQRLEQALRDYLSVKHVKLFCNGTVALLSALQALDIQDGEVITTPFTFPATPHALNWNRTTPVFCDIDPATYNLDPNRLEEAITAETKAILPVHVFGTPCDVDAIQTIADRHGIPVIYDAAHTFGVRYRGRALADYGDIAALSFHATKLFTTGEGGALVCHSPGIAERVHYLKNFGIAGEESVLYPGINGKMSELNAAFGLESLNLVSNEISALGNIHNQYNEILSGMPGLTLPHTPAETEQNFSYYPIRISAREYGASRDTVNNALRSINIFPRKYFYPLCSRIDSYRNLPSAHPNNLPHAESVANDILCLPNYGALEESQVAAITGALRVIHETVGDQ